MSCLHLRRSLWLAVVLALCGWGRCDDVSALDGGADGVGASDAGNTTLVWSDEFEGPAGQLPSAANWIFNVSGDGWGNNQLEYDTNLAQNASLDGLGDLAITALDMPYMGNAYTSARLSTEGLGQYTYGRFEARMQMPTGQGMWPAFWLLGADYATDPWPACGEIDIMEYQGQLVTTVHGSMHGPGYSGGNAITAAYTDPAGLNGGFHVYDLDWTPTSVTWSVDGVAYETVTPDDIPTGDQWVFNHPFFIILNLAVGGNYVGPPNGSTTFPQTFLIDYVRVYGSAT